MGHAPRFWQRDGSTFPQALLRPAGAVTAALTARRVARAGWQAPVPVVCCGNATLGGAGKTTLALDLLKRLQARGAVPHALLRGYGGAARGLRRVEPGDDFRQVGDEALLLAERAPTWIGADRAASARAAVAAGAGALVLDDGLQNPSLRKDLSVLVVDGGFGFGNGQVFPAGPLREPVAAAAARCRAAVLIGDDQAVVLDALPRTCPVLRASLLPTPDAAQLAGQRVFAFAGIARPEKFFASLEEVGAVIVGRRGFADHHRFTDAELHCLEDDAARLRAAPVTTAKDAVRLPARARSRVSVLEVTLAWRDENEIEGLLTELLSERG